MSKFCVVKYMMKPDSKYSCCSF